jgi:hypothetical protein
MAAQAKIHCVRAKALIELFKSISVSANGRKTANPECMVRRCFASEE